MTTTKKLSLATIVVLFISPALVMMWTSLLMTASYNGAQIAAAVGLLLFGFFALLLTAVLMD